MDTELAGIIDHIVFENAENGFTVAKLRKRAKHHDDISIVGYFPELKAGELISCQGEWKHHPSFGKQFQVKSFQLSIPKDSEGIFRYLQSGAIQGIGPVIAKRIIEAFGEETLNIIDNEPMRLSEISGLGEKKVEKIIDRWQEQQSMRDVLIFLRGHGVGASLTQKIYRKYGQDCIEMIQENPYILARDLRGVGFKTSDQIARKLNITKDHPQRLEAGIEHLLQTLSEQGHVCYPEEEFLKKCEELLEVERSNLYQAINALEQAERIYRRELTTESEPVLFLWLAALYRSEIGIAKEIERLQRFDCSIRSVKEERALDWVEEKHHIHLADEQKTAIVKALQEKIHIITGGPGTGKSTVTKTILSIHEPLSDKILLCAPTGRAAKRLSQITRRRASTIHSLLEFDFTAYSFKKNRENPLDVDLIIIDEVSMIDTYLMYALLKAIPDTARIIFIGDVDQLPSIGAGNILKDFIESQIISTTRLFKIFRQAKGSHIVQNAHKIQKGLFPCLDAPQEKSDFLFFPLEDPQEIIQSIKNLVQEQIPASFSMDSIKDIQVLSPMRRGILGIENLNIFLQNALNPTTMKIEKMGKEFRLSDKIMQLHNNYTKKVFNGDVGFVQEIDLEEQTLTALFGSREIVYETHEFDELALAYAVSVHKYQGSECPCIIMPIHTTHFKLLQRNLLYTAITRGKKLVVLIGMKKAVALAIQNNEFQKRHTGLSYFLGNNFDFSTFFT